MCTAPRRKSAKGAARLCSLRQCRLHRIRKVAPTTVPFKSKSVSHKAWKDSPLTPELPLPPRDEHGTSTAAVHGITSHAVRVEKRPTVCEKVGLDFAVYTRLQAATLQKLVGPPLVEFAMLGAQQYGNCRNAEAIVPGTRLRPVCPARSKERSLD